MRREGIKFGRHGSKFRCGFVSADVFVVSYIR